MNLLKIYGLRRTGTNYLQWLLCNNFKCLVLLIDVFSWKHGRPVIVPGNINSLIHNPKDYRLSNDLNDIPNIDKDPCYLLSIKDPYSWYISMCSWHNIDPLPVERDKLNLFFLWNYMASEYKKFHEKNDSIIIRYEDLLADLDGSLESIAKYLYTDLVYPISDLPTEVYNGKSFAEKRKYYLSKQYMNIYKGRDLKNIEMALDVELLRYFKYDPKDV